MLDNTERVMKKIYLYAGYYELYITDKEMPKPYTLISWHKSVENAMKAAERFDDYASVIYAEHLFPEEYRLLMGEDHYQDLKRAEIDGLTYLIV